jgi:hypothetical protein
MFSPSTLPEPLAGIAAQLRHVADEPPAMPTPDDRAAWLAGLAQVMAAADAVFTQTLARFDAAGDGETLHGARSTASWLRGACGLAPGEAAGRVHVARQSRGALAPAVRALAQGEVTFSEVAQISRALRQLPGSTHAEAVEVLLDLAKRTDAAAVAVAGRRLAEVVDPDGAARAAQDQFQRRSLHLSPLLDGMTAVDGLLDAEAAELVTTALAPFLVPLGRDDERTTAQRRADGLVELARGMCDHGLLPELGGRRPHLEVVVPVERLFPEAGEALANAGPGRDAPDLPREAVRRIGCDATVSRILVGPDSEVLDLGRRQRLFSRQQRRALAIRDGGCRFPGCSRIPAFTDAHHIVSWVRGGPTDLANAVLLCRFHHRLVHEGGWTICLEQAPRGANGDITFGGPRGQLLRGP